MKFNYKARTKEGKLETGVVEAYSKEAAALLLQKYNIFVISLEEKRGRESFLSKIKLERKVSIKDLAIFSRQLSVMLESRVPVVQSLSSLAVQIRKDYFRKIILEISNLAEQGVPLSQAMANYPKVFNSLYVNLVKSGEASGNISKTLYYLSEHLEREHDTISQVKQALIYPVFVIAVLFIVVFIVIVLVLPRVSALVKEATSQPPFFTLLMLRFYSFIGSYWWILALILFLLVISIFSYFRKQKGKDNFDRISLKIPFLKSFLKKVFLVRFCGNVSTLIVSGISINKALKITEDTVNNLTYKKIIVEVGNGVSRGEKISSVLTKHQDYFPPFVVQMIKVGEETGKLDKTLLEIVSFYEKEIKRSIDLFSRLLEPIIIIFLGIVVALLAISVLSPLYGALGNLASNLYRSGRF